MLRRFIVPVLAAVALAGIMLLPSPAVAEGRPGVLRCQIQEGERDLIALIPIDWENGGMHEAVALCLDMGGHPVGVEEGKEM